VPNRIKTVVSMPDLLGRLRGGHDALRGAGFPRTVYGYLWRISGRHQVALSALAVAVFLMSMGPLELQRRIVNDVIRGGQLETLVWLCAGYAALALTMGATKLCLNVYRGYIGEMATIDLRRRIHRLMAPAARKRDVPAEAAEAEGVEIAIVVAEVEPVGGFVGISISEPLLQGGILLTVTGYMVYLQPWMALASLVLFSPQLVFVPLLQRAINRRAAERIQIVREVSAGLVEDGRRPPSRLGHALFENRIASVLLLNMQIFRRKFLMNFLMNGTYHIGVTGILLIGGWFVITGRTELGTVVAFLSGLAQLNDPWGDIVNYFRESSMAQVKYRLIAGAVDSATQERDRPAAVAPAA
jgi:ABC-type multidrug transport system fused ATPase/permease subunit